MSRKVVELVYSKKCGNVFRKAVLVAMADRANDDGTGVWVSKARIAAEVECSRQTVIKTVEELINDGLLQYVKKRSKGHGYTVEYDLVIHRILCLPDAHDLKRPDVDTSVTKPATVHKQTAKCPDADSELPKSGQRSVNPVDTNRPVTTTTTPADTGEPDNGKAERKTDPWIERIFEVAGPGLVTPQQNYNVLLDLMGRITSWRMAGWDLEDDIVPVISTKTAQPRDRGPLRTFKYLEEDIARFHAQRLKPAPIVEINDVQSASPGGAAGRTGGNARGYSQQRPGGQHGGSGLALAAARNRERRAVQSDLLDEHDRRDDWVA